MKKLQTLFLLITLSFSGFSQIDQLATPYLKKCAKVDSLKRKSCSQELVFEIVKYRIDQQMQSVLYDFAQTVDISFFVNAKGRVSKVEILSDTKAELQEAIMEAYLLLPKFITDPEMGRTHMFEFRNQIYFTYQ